jgi:hypothetical protein
MKIQNASFPDIPRQVTFQRNDAAVHFNTTLQEKEREMHECLSDCIVMM